MFRRRPTDEAGHRGFRLSSLGILLAKGDRPKPWRHVAALTDAIETLYSHEEQAEERWDSVKRFFEQRRVPSPLGDDYGKWTDWPSELSGDALNPVLHLPHMARILGPSILTLFKYVMGRKRVLIYTLPPVQAACVLCHVVAGMGWESQKAKGKPSVDVLGMVTLMDLDRMQTGEEWVACTTDAIFLEKPAYYDLLIDLTTSTPNKASRPTFYASKVVVPPVPTAPLTSSASSFSSSSSSQTKYKLTTIRFAWSDVRLWNELDRILQLDESHGHASCCSPSPSSSFGFADKSKFITAWTDVWRVYEDVCIVCAGLWTGGWRGNSRASYSTAGGQEWGSVRLEGDDDLSLGALRSEGGLVRALGNGIEGRPSMGSVSSAAPLALAPDQDEDDDAGFRTTLALLQTFHSHALFHIGTLQRFIDMAPQGAMVTGPTVVVLSAKDVAAFELGPWSSVDSKYLEWLGEVYGVAGGGGEVQIVVRKGWRDVLGVVFGY